MSDIFAMQRANGDWFALDHYGRLRVPIFHSIHDAMMARLRNFGLLLFKPVVVDAVFLKKIVPLPGEDEVDFCMIDDPFASLTRGANVGRRELALLILPTDENIASNGNKFHAPILAHSVKVTVKQLRLGRMKEAHTQSMRELRGQSLAF